MAQEPAVIRLVGGTAFLSFDWVEPPTGGPFDIVTEDALDTLVTEDGLDTVVTEG